MLFVVAKLIELANHLKAFDLLGLRQIERRPPVSAS
jgi:hypothetical protein